MLKMIYRCDGLLRNVSVVSDLVRTGVPQRATDFVTDINSVQDTLKGSASYLILPDCLVETQTFESLNRFMDWSSVYSLYCCIPHYEVWWGLEKDSVCYRERSNKAIGQHECANRTNQSILGNKSFRQLTLYLPEEKFLLCNSSSSLLENVM